jgi:hypothetical protein
MVFRRGEVVNAFFPQAADVAHLIQVALTPIFLISAIGVTLNVLTNIYMRHSACWRGALATSTRRSP